MDTEVFADIVAAVRDFVRGEVVPAEEEIAETNAIPQRLRATAADMGLFGYALPEEYGGLGVTMSEDVALAVEFGYATPAFRSMFGTNNGIAGQVLVNYGTDEQRAQYLPKLADGSLVAAFALTEAEAGSDPSGMRATARPDGSGYVIDGVKRFITNAPVAGVFVVFARTDPESVGSKGISALLVPAGSPGLTVGPPDAKMGQAGALTAEVVFDGVRVDRDALIGGVEGEGFQAAMRSLARGRLHIAALCVGLAQRLVHEAVEYAKVNRQGGTPIGEFQLVQAMLAESHAEAYAGLGMVTRAAQEYDAGTDRRLAPSACKLFCSEMVGRVADRAVQVHGGMGYMRSVAVERLYRDARLFRLYEGTSEIQKLVVARRLLA